MSINYFGNDFCVEIMTRERITINSFFDADSSFSSFDYFFVPGPMGLLKFVPEEVFRSTDSIDNVSINICRKCKNGKILKSFFFDS